MAVEDFHPPQLPPFIAVKDPQHQKPITGYTSQSLLLYNQSSLILAWTVHYVI